MFPFHFPIPLIPHDSTHTTQIVCDKKPKGIAEEFNLDKILSD